MSCKKKIINVPTHQITSTNKNPHISPNKKLLHHRWSSLYISPSSSLFISVEQLIMDWNELSLRWIPKKRFRININLIRPNKWVDIQFGIGRLRVLIKMHKRTRNFYFSILFKDMVWNYVHEIKQTWIMSLWIQCNMLPKLLVLSATSRHYEKQEFMFIYYNSDMPVKVSMYKYCMHKFAS